MLHAIPKIAQRPGEFRVPHGNRNSAGYWCLTHWTDAPQLPDVALAWAEDFVLCREFEFRALLTRKYNVNLYIGLFSNVLALGFDLPPTPTIWKLGIPICLEFSRLNDELVTSEPQHPPHRDAGCR